MIQRIQTVYLLLSMGLLGLLFWFPLADITASGELYLFSIPGIYKVGEMVASSLWLLILLITIILLHLFAILSYKKRTRQIRVLIFSIILLLGLFGLFFWFACMSFKGAGVSFRISVAFPVVAIILDYLAIRGIGKDEALIRSLNRIR
jgi:Domain of unknown function (DUF4293)